MTKRPRRKPPTKRKIITIAATVAAVVAVLAALPATAELYVDLRWFRTLRFEQVFTTILSTKIMLGLAVGALLIAALVINLRIAERMSQGLPTMRLRDPEGVPRLDLGTLVPRLLRGAAAVLGIMAGISAADHWSTWLLFRHATDFGTVDPIFGRDIGFYVFTMPLLEALRTLGFWVLGLSAVVTAVTYLVRGALVIEGRPIRLEGRARTHLSILGALLFVLLAYDAWLSTAELLYSTMGPVSGASYADVNAALPLLRVQIGVAAVSAVLVAVGMTRKRLVLPGAAVALYLVVALLGVRLYPAAVHRFSVLPNEAVKEAPYIRHNIDATRAAYGIDHVIERELSGEVALTMADVEANRATIDNIRVWDHRPLLDTFAQIQEIRTYYEFASVDNDRYMIDGKLTQTMLSPRELASESLPNRTWINEHFTFTHGYGLTLGPVNRATNEGLPVLKILDIPPVSHLRDIRVTRPQIYYGEMTNDYVFVKTANREFDYPSGEDNVYSTYEGHAGVRLDSLVTVGAVSLHIGSLKLLLSEDINDDSRVLLYRNIRERVKRIAPFLTYDRDPYMVIRKDGTLTWIQDAYTVSRRYPYSEPSPDGINYIRNSVKIAIDAFNGRVTFYVVDDTDPVLRAWRGAFPHLFRPLSDMPADLHAHLRYPEDLFRVQTDMFTVYHMDSPELVYNREDQWEVPAITAGDASTRLEPYYTIMRLPEETDEEYIQMLPFTPKRKENLSAWMVARMDGENLGDLVVYRFPKRRLVFGPGQIMNRINQDADISRQISLWDQRGSEAILGTLLVIPIEESLIYVCPLYLRSSGGRIPELKRVIVVYQNRIAMEPTLDQAVRSVFREGPAEPVAQAGPPAAAGEPGAEEPGETPEEPGETPEEPGTSGEAPPAAAAGELSSDPRIRARQLFDRATAAQRRGDWARYGDDLEALGETLEELRMQAQGTQPPPSSP